MVKKSIDLRFMQTIIICEKPLMVRTCQRWLWKQMYCRVRETVVQESQKSMLGCVWNVTASKYSRFFWFFTALELLLFTI